MTAHSSSPRLVIAIDGPSGAGKGSVSRAVASALGYRHVDTGAMYRAIGWKARADGVALDDEAGVRAIAERARIDLDAGQVVVDGADVTRAIRTPDIDRAAAAVARMPRVREVLVARQRAMARAGGIVMEGRDIGTVVCPAADLKIYLDASPEERARRRANDPAHTGGGEPLDSVALALAARDRQDQTRAISPLAMAPDAVPLDTTGVPLEEVVDRVMELVRARLNPT